jgi:K+/H+ antiporter YhaU regulatory subunit KhtT
MRLFGSNRIATYNDGRKDARTDIRKVIARNEANALTQWLKQIVETDILSEIASFLAKTHVCKPQEAARKLLFGQPLGVCDFWERILYCVLSVCDEVKRLRLSA